MTGQLGVIYMLCFHQPYRHARHYVGWTEDLLDRLDGHASGHGARLIEVIYPSRDRLHPGPHLRRHPPPRARHQERRRRGPVLPGLHPPSPQRPVGSDARRPHPPHLPQPCRKAVTPHVQDHRLPQPATNPYQLEELFVKFHRTPAGIAWRWRAELAILAILAAALVAAGHLITLTWAGIVLAALVGLVAGVPHSRRFITRRFWCVLARHRLHRLCYEARLHTRAGRLPLILWIRPTQVGERAWVLCRAGISAEDFQDRTERAARRLLRPRRAGHPQPPLVPPGDHRHHPPRHPRGQQHHLFPAGAADRALRPPPGPGPRPAPRPRATSTTRPRNPDRRSPWHCPGDRPHLASKGGTCA